MNNIKEESIKTRGLQIIGEMVGHLAVLQVYQETIQRVHAVRTKPVFVLYKADNIK